MVTQITAPSGPRRAGSCLLCRQPGCALAEFVRFLLLSEFIRLLGSMNGIIVPVDAGRADAQAARRARDGFVRAVRVGIGAFDG
jgi:hypothetical protein